MLAVGLLSVTVTETSTQNSIHAPELPDRFPTYYPPALIIIINNRVEQLGFKAALRWKRTSLIHPIMYAGSCIFATTRWTMQSWKLSVRSTMGDTIARPSPRVFRPISLTGSP